MFSRQERVKIFMSRFHGRAGKARAKDSQNPAQCCALPWSPTFRGTAQVRPHKHSLGISMVSLRLPPEGPRSLGYTSIMGDFEGYFQHPKHPGHYKMSWPKTPKKPNFQRSEFQEIYENQDFLVIFKTVFWVFEILWIQKSLFSLVTKSDNP